MLQLQLKGMVDTYSDKILSNIRMVVLLYKRNLFEIDSSQTQNRNTHKKKKNQQPAEKQHSNIRREKMCMQKPSNAFFHSYRRPNRMMPSPYIPCLYLAFDYFISISNMYKMHLVFAKKHLCTLIH